MTPFEQIRRDLDEYPADLVHWEAACLRDMANLLDSLERARSEWQSLSTQLSEAKSSLAEEMRLREELATLRARAEGLATAEQAAIVALERLAEAEGGLASARERGDAAEAELAAARERLETVQRERDVLAENEQGAAQLKAEAAELRARLKRAERAKADLHEERDRASSLARELDRTRERLVDAEKSREELGRELDNARARAEALERDCAEARKEAEQQMVLACDLHAKLNRLERERDDALAYGHRKVKRILEKIHETLDAAGAPRGEDISFGDRVRWLATRADVDAEAGGEPGRESRGELAS